MATWLAIEIRKVQLGQIPAHRDSATSSNLACSCSGHDLRGQNGQLPQPFFVAPRASNPYLPWVGKLIKGEIKRRLAGHSVGVGDRLIYSLLIPFMPELSSFNASQTSYPLNPPPIVKALVRLPYPIHPHSHPSGPRAQE